MDRAGIHGGLSAAELDAAQRAAEPGAQDSSIPEVFAAVAARHSRRVAVVCEDRRICYAELAAMASRIAAELRRRGIGRSHRVGLYAGRSPETIAAILGILDAGACYVPFDPSYPPSLLQFIESDSAPALMLVQGDLLEGGGRTFPSGPVLDIGGTPLASSGDGEASFAGPPQGPAGRSRVAPDDLAYIMYTSGSTGRPKGVMVPHRAVLRLVIDNSFARFGSDEVLLQLAPLSFDASTFEIWAALLHGGCLAILRASQPSLDDIAAAIARHGVTTVWLTAGLFHLMVDHRLDGLAPLHQLLAGGDVLSRAHVDRVLKALPGCRLINGYGPTENTTFSCCYTIPREGLAEGPIPIGMPINRTSGLVLDERLRPVPDGDEGELCVGGAGLAAGYLNRPELNAERFVQNPFDASGRTRLYRTGDRVRRRADGNLLFLGRVDRQVKINGKRVELDEIENAIRRSGLVDDAAVASVDGAAGVRRIAAFVTASAPAALDALRTFLRAELPDYMQPSTIEWRQALPLSPTGKVDRARLIAETKAAPVAMEARPAGAVEAELLRIWREALATDAVSTDRNFFDLGGTSLQMLKVHALIRNVLKIDVDIVELFNHPRIDLLARRLAGEHSRPGGAVPTADERAKLQRAALARLRPAPTGTQP